MIHPDVQIGFRTVVGQMILDKDDSLALGHPIPTQ
jgi:hypothetical protein